MQSSVKKIIQYIILLAIGGALIYLSIQRTQVSKEELYKAFQNTNKIWILVSLLVSFFSHLVRAYRWNFLLENYQLKTDLFTSTSSVFIGYLANYGLPRMGEISRCAIASKYNKIPIDIALGTVIAERVVDLLLLFTIFIFVILFQFQDLQTLLNKYILIPLSEKFSGQNVFYLLLIILFFVFVFFILMKRKKSTSETPLFDKVIQVIRNLITPLLSIHKIPHPFAFWWNSLLIWILYFLSMYFCALSMPSTEHIGFLKIMVLFLFGTIGVIITPGGIGAYHFLITELLLFYQTDNASAVAFPWIIWGTQFLLVVLVSMLAFIFLPIYHTIKTENNDKF